MNTRVPGISKPMNKSKYVNEALDFYMNRNLKEMIEQNRTLKRNLTAGLIQRDQEIEQRDQEIENLTHTIGGVKAQLEHSLDTILHLEGNIQSLEDQIRSLQDSPGLLYRLKRLLKI